MSSSWRSVPRISLAWPQSSRVSCPMRKCALPSGEETVTNAEQMTSRRSRHSCCADVVLTSAACLDIPTAVGSLRMPMESRDGKQPAAAGREAPILMPVASRSAVSLRHFERRGAAGEADRNEDLFKQCSDLSVIDRSAARCRPCSRGVVFGGPLSAYPSFLLQGR